MKLLLLGNSMDIQREVVAEERRGSLIVRDLEEAIGEPVDIVVKTFWPSARIPRLVGEWLAAERPDMLLITATAYPFAYPSVPVRIGRLFGPLGPQVRRLGVGAANRPWIAHNAAFRAVRRLAQLSIGGSTYMSVDEVVANISEAVRVAVRHEDVIVVLKGPGGGGRYSPPRGQRGGPKRSASGCSMRSSGSAERCTWTSSATTCLTICATRKCR